MPNLKVVAVVVSIAAASCIGSAADAATPAGWQQVADKAGRCSISVPGDWTAVIKTAPQSPNKNSQTIISSSDLTTSLADLKPIATQMMKPTKVFEDSSSRLWYQFEGNEGTGTHWYVAVPAKAAVCIAQVTFKSDTDVPTLKMVATSLSAAH